MTGLEVFSEADLAGFIGSSVPSENVPRDAFVTSVDPLEVRYLHPEAVDMPVSRTFVPVSHLWVGAPVSVWNVHGSSLTLIGMIRSVSPGSDWAPGQTVRVANRAEANSWLNMLVSRGIDLSVTPLYVDRADTGTLERNSGSSWVSGPAFGDTGWLPCVLESGFTTGGTTPGTLEARQVGAQVSVRGGVRGSIPGDTYTTVATLPAGITRPVSTRRFGIMGTGGRPCTAEIISTGAINYVWRASAVSQPSWIAGDITYRAA